VELLKDFYSKLEDSQQEQSSTSSEQSLNYFGKKVKAKYDSRVEDYQRKVQSKAFSKNVWNITLTVGAAISVFMVWSKIRRLKKQFIL